MGSPASSHAVRGASVRPGAVAGVIRLHTEGEVGTWPASALDTITRCDRMNRLSVARVGVAYMSDRTGVGGHPTSIQHPCAGRVRRVGLAHPCHSIRKAAAGVIRPARTDGCIAAPSTIPSSPAAVSKSVADRPRECDTTDFRGRAQSDGLNHAITDAAGCGHGCFTDDQRSDTLDGAAKHHESDAGHSASRDHV